MILLRNNLLTYCQGSDLQSAFNRIVSHLSPGGCLVTGTQERLPGFDFPLVREEGCPWVYRLER